MINDHTDTQRITVHITMVPSLVYQELSGWIQLVVTHERNSVKLECGPMPNLMVALPNIGGAICSTPQSLADAHY